MAFYFLEKDQGTVFFRNFRKKLQNQIMLREALVYGRRLIGRRVGGLHPLRVFGGEIAFVNQLPHTLLTQIVVAFVDRDFVNPGQQRTPEVEILDREIDFGENLLGDIFSVVAVAQNAVNDRENTFA